MRLKWRKRRRHKLSIACATQTFPHDVRFIQISLIRDERVQLFVAFVRHCEVIISEKNHVRAVPNGISHLRDARLRELTARTIEEIFNDHQFMHGARELVGFIVVISRSMTAYG